MSWILPSFCSRQGPPLWNWANFDHFCPLLARANVIWLQKVVSNTSFTYLGKVKKNWQLFALIFFGESKKYDRGADSAPPPHPRVKLNRSQTLTLCICAFALKAEANLEKVLYYEDSVESHLLSGLCTTCNQEVDFRTSPTSREANHHRFIFILQYLSRSRVACNDSLWAVKNISSRITRSSRIIR